MDILGSIILKRGTGKAMKCSKCGANLEFRDLFCRECGTRIEHKVNQFCRSCGTKLEDGGKFCPKCGKEVVDLTSYGDDSTIKIENNTGKVQQKSDILGRKIKETVLNLWSRLDTFSKTIVVVSVFVLILAVTSICIGRVLPIIISVIQIGAVVVTALLHKGIISIKWTWVKYLILCVAIALSIGNIASYFVGNQNVGVTTVTQQDIKVSAPCNATACIGKQKDNVINEFVMSGFVNITENTLEDLSLDEADINGCVESVTIDNISDFTANQEFVNTSNVLITYHSFMLIAVPVDAASAEAIEPEELIRLFKDAGFINIKVDEVFDLDPDEENVEFKNTITVDAESDFSATSKYPLDSSIEIITHRTYEKCVLKVVVEFVENLLFNTYDVELEINGNTETINHGEDSMFEYRLKPGNYTVTFTSTKSSSVMGTVEIEVSGDTEVSYKITCYSDKINVETLYVENRGSIGENEAMVPYSASACRYKNYKDVEMWFKNAGFTNISTKILYDIVWGWTDEGEVEEVAIDGKTDFIRGDIFNKGISVVITYHMKEEDDPSNETEMSKPSANEEIYDLDKDLIVVQCEKDKAKTTMYRITFAECDKNGNYTNFYTFDDIINPRAMGKEFNAIGALPEWFYVGATVHVKANLMGGAISQSGCSVTKAEVSSKESTNNAAVMPIMKGTSLESIVDIAKAYGLSAQFSDEDWGNGTKMHGMSSDGLTIDIVYSANSKELLMVNIVTYTNLSTIQEQMNFIKAVAGVACPSADSAEVLQWVNDNIGDVVSTTIGNVTYELFIGTTGNLCYSAGEVEWETWDLAVN